MSRISHMSVAMARRHLDFESEINLLLEMRCKAERKQSVFHPVQSVPSRAS